MREVFLRFSSNQRENVRFTETLQVPLLPSLQELGEGELC